jgi:crotonobetainyl-CoA:carnitine CoA-transferase CaiB-like acyl-CoA transferase
MALLHRERSGEGQQVDVPMLECMTAFNLLEHAAGMLFEPPLGEPG